MVGTIIAHLTKTGIVKYQADNVFRMVSGLCYPIFRMAHSIVAFGGDCHDGVGGLKAQTLVGYVGIRWVGFGRSQGKVASGRVCKCMGITWM